MAGKLSNPAFTIFRLAWRSQRTNPLGTAYSIFMWSVAAFYIGVSLYGIVPDLFDQRISEYTGYIIYACLPIFIGQAVNFARISINTADEYVKATPLTASEVLIPRTIAILLTLFMDLLPLYLIMIISEHRSILSGDQSSIFRSIGNIVDPNSYGMMLLVFNFNSSAFQDARYAADNSHAAYLINNWDDLFFIGAIFLPMAWGLLISTVHGIKQDKFYHIYYLHLIPPILFYLSIILSKPNWIINVSSLNYQFTLDRVVLGILWIELLYGVMTAVILLILAVLVFYRRDR